MPLALTLKGLWNVCAPDGRIVDAFIANKLSKGVDECIIWIEVSGLPLCAWGSNAYKKIAESFGKFLFFDKEESRVLSTGRVCISTKSQQLIYENVQADLNNGLYEALVQEIGSWHIKINDDYIDTSSNGKARDLDNESEHIDEQLVDDLEQI
ncbi:hypothetical protein Tco_1278490 [Tanacetum coccineum]